MPRGKTHYIADSYKSKTTACGIKKGKVFNTEFQDLVDCHNCKWSLAYRERRK